MTAFARNKLPNRKSAFQANAIGSATFTVGTEASDTITVNVQLKDEVAKALRVRGHVRAFLANDSAGAALATSPPQRVIAGTNGIVTTRPASMDRLLIKGTLVIDAVPEKFKTTTTAYYAIGSIQYTKTAATAIVFSAAHVVSASKFGVILIQVNAAGTVSTKVPLTPQAYTTAPLALAALPTPDVGNVALGYIAIAAKAATWTANTDDMTNGSDLTTATFVDGTELSGPRLLDLVTNASGQADVVIAETGIKTFYLAVLLPDGSISVSSAIAFA